jgi:hypothetical protein
VKDLQVDPACSWTEIGESTAPALGSSSLSRWQAGFDQPVIIIPFLSRLITINLLDMKQQSTIFSLMMTCMLLVLILPAALSQATQDTLWTAADVTLGSGTGQELGDFKDRNLGADASMEICNFDDNESLMSYFESWCQFDLSGVPALIPDGEEILYAEIVLKVSNNTGQGYYAYHLMDADDWQEGNGSSGALSTEGGLTWTDAQAFDYENEANYTLINMNPETGGVSYIEEFDVTSAVAYEMGVDGNQKLTIRFKPYIFDYDPVTSPKKWLGFYARQAPWGSQHPTLGIANDAAHIIFYIGPAEPTKFSDVESFGEIGNYKRTPSKYGYWLVRDDEGDARLKINQRPAPINKTPGGLALYKVQESYGDFDITVKAKVNSTSSKADFVIPFGYVDGENYTYMYFTANDESGFYMVDTAGKTPVGDLNTTPALSDTAYHDYRLVRSGTTVTAYIDGTEYLSRTDDALGTAGMIGMGSYNDIALFDDFEEGGGGTGMADEMARMSVRIYPNPAADAVFVEADQGIQSLVITNIAGQECMILNVLKDGVTEINTSKLEPGVYFMTVRSSKGDLATNRFIIR